VLIGRSGQQRGAGGLSRGGEEKRNQKGRQEDRKRAKREARGRRADIGNELVLCISAGDCRLRE